LVDIQITSRVLNSSRQIGNISFHAVYDIDNKTCITYNVQKITAHCTIKEAHM